MSYKFEPNYDTTHENLSRTDRSLQGFNDFRSIPETPWDLDFVRVETTVVFYVFNSFDTSITFSSYSAVADDGMEVVSPIASAFPITIKAGQAEKFEILVTLEGPVQFDAVFVLVTSGGNLQVRLYGVRAPFISGVTATLFWPHNWVSGFSENLAWKTQIMTAYDGTETRMGFRPLPRKQCSLSYLVKGFEAQRLRAYLAAKRVDYFYIPTWSDLGSTSAPYNAGEVSIVLPTTGRAYEIGQRIIVFSPDGSYEESSIISVSGTNVTLLNPFSKDYAEGTPVAPMWPYFLVGSVSEKQHTDEALELSCTMESVYDMDVPKVYEQEVYGDYEVLPMLLNFIVGNDSTDHKWKYLDNTTGLPLIVRESDEPIYCKVLSVSLSSRAEVYIFRQFMHSIRGMAIPFWVSSRANDIHPLSGWLVGEQDITINFIGYVATSFGEKGKEYIQIDYKDGTFERYKIIDAQFNPVYVDREVIKVSPSLATDRELTDIARISFFQLVRFNTDEFGLTWGSVDKLECSLPIKVLV